MDFIIYGTQSQEAQLQALYNTCGSTGLGCNPHAYTPSHSFYRELIRETGRSYAGYAARGLWGHCDCGRVIIRQKGTQAPGVIPGPHEELGY